MELQNINIQTWLFFMLETHTTVTSLARCKVELLKLVLLLLFIFLLHQMLVCLFLFFSFFFFNFILGQEEALFSRMQKSNLNFCSAGSHVIHLIFLSGFIMKSKAILNWWHNNLMLCSNDYAGSKNMFSHIEEIAKFQLSSS